MKLAKIWLAAGAVVIMLGMKPGESWATRAMEATVTGEITSSPSSQRIEVAHHPYVIQPNSAAAKSAATFFLGQVVDLTLTAAGVGGESEVVAITAHAGS